VIKLDGSFNTRCFGGQNPWLVRSGNLDNLTDLGKAQLAALGLQRVVDLRDPAEKGANTQHHRFPTVSIPIFGQIGEPGKQHSFTSYYRIILQRNGGPLARAVAAIAQASGPALVHCAIGKDRTGLVVALVLLAAGATHEQVVADYARSAAGQPASRVAAVTKQLAELGLVPGSVQAVEHLQRELASPPEAMTNALAYLDEVGGWRNYLLTHGVSQLLLNRLADRPL
jgi:hypothetical protein